jgi:phage terminase large subunit-like protein
VPERVIRIGREAVEAYITAEAVQLDLPLRRIVARLAQALQKQAAERVHQRGERESNLIRIKEVSASRGKAMRAEPISLLYEKGRVLHRRGLDQLEAEMMAFSRPALCAFSEDAQDRDHS